MAQTVTKTTSLLASLLRADDGVNNTVANLSLDELPGVAPAEIVELHAPADLTEKAANVKYPVIHIYCDRIVNSLKEKFRTFSGTADLNIEVRVSHDHMQELQQQLQSYLDGVTDVLERKRGKWSDTTYYAGGYEIVYSPIKRGGRNYIQSAKVKLELHIHED